jgi:hypothetical protein
VVEFALASVVPCQELDSSLSSCAYVMDIFSGGAFLARGFRRVRRRLLSDGGTADARAYTYRSQDSVCRDALASDALLFTRASCQAAFDASNVTLALLGLERQLPACAFCSLADALEAARHNPLAFLHLLTPRTLGLVLQRHGPLGQLARLGGIVHEGVREVAALLAARRLAGNASDASRAVAVERRAGELLVRVEALPLPPHVARAGAPARARAAAPRARWRWRARAAPATRARRTQAPLM